MVTLSNAQVVQALAALRQLAQERVPVIGALRMRKVIRTLQERADDIEAERRKLLEMHGQKKEDGTLDTDDKGNVRFFDQAAVEAFAKEYEELMAATLDTEYPIRVSDLGKIDVSTQTVMALGDLLVEE